MPSVIRLSCLLIGVALRWQQTAAFLPQVPQTHYDVGATILQNNKFDRDLQEKSRQKAIGSGGETVAGAVLGGLLLGPVGAIFGASIGRGVGSNNSVEKARKAELERIGITEEMLTSAQECGMALERSMEGLTATQDSLQTQQSLARMFDKDVTDTYEKAKKALENGDEDKAKTLLFERTKMQEKLKSVLMQCAEAKKRLEQMENNVASIERRAKEVEALLQRTIAAKSSQDLSTTDLSSIDLTLSSEDPLLKKFRDAGID